MYEVRPRSSDIYSRNLLTFHVTGLQTEHSYIGSMCLPASPMTANVRHAETLTLQSRSFRSSAMVGAFALPKCPNALHTASLTSLYWSWRMPASPTVANVRHAEA